MVKTVSDYYDVVADKFPIVPKKDIERILNFGWKSLYLHNVYGGDTLLKDDAINKYLFYIGELTFDSLKHFHYYIKKMSVKLRVLYNRAKDKWDGYYYFGLTQNQYNNYLSQNNKRGRKRKKFKFGSIKLYKILEECKLREYNKEYFFRVPYILDAGFTILENDYETSKAEYLLYRKCEGFASLNK